MASFREELADNVVSFFVDNSGALNGFIKGGFTSAEQNIIISEAWMCFAREHIAAQF